jgi:hypothetical protein
MEDKKYYYARKFDKSVIELKLNKADYIAALQQWQKGDLILFKDLNNQSHPVPATQLVALDNVAQYQAWREQTNPRHYILYGNWYTSDDPGVPYRHEAWRGEQLRKQQVDSLKLGKPNEVADPDVRRRGLASMREVLKANKLTK